MTSHYRSYGEELQRSNGQTSELLMTELIGLNGIATRARFPITILDFQILKNSLLIDHNEVSNELFPLRRTRANLRAFLNALILSLLFTTSIVHVHLKSRWSNLNCSLQRLTL